MTYEEALKARARLAYSQNALTKMAFRTKQAAESAPDEGIPPAVQEATDIADHAGYEAMVNENEELKNQIQNTKYGLGAGGVGLATGAGIGAATYGLTGLFPSLKKRRLLRALIALGAGGASGAGLGYLTYRGLQNGTVQDWAGKARTKADQALNWGKEKGKQVYNKAKEVVNGKPDPRQGAIDNDQPYAVTAKEQETGTLPAKSKGKG